MEIENYFYSQIELTVILSAAPAPKQNPFAMHSRDLLFSQSAWHTQTCLKSGYGCDRENQKPKKKKNATCAEFVFSTLKKKKAHMIYFRLA